MDRHLAAILAADVVGYSSLIKQDELGTIADVKANLNELIEPKIAEHKGRIVKLMGDGLLAEFPSVVDAVQCAVDIQQNIAERFSNGPTKTELVYRIGINIGDIVVEGDDIHGDGVNVAARLETLSKPGGICIAHNVFDQVKDKLDLNFEHMGKKKIKNIAEPITIYSVNLDDKAATLATPVIHLAKKSGRLTGTYAMVTALALLLIVGGAYWWQTRAPDFEPANRSAMALALPDKPSVAVLPFDNLSNEEGQEYFADGMTDDLITDLSKLSGLFVISRNSTFTYKGTPVKIRQVAEELGVRYVLEGSVRRIGDQVRINAQLIDSLSGYHVWAERYDGSLADVFKMQDKVIGQIVAALAVSLTTPETNQNEIAETEVPEAYDAFLQGLVNYRRKTPQDFAKAIDLFEKAIELDPGYSRAHANLAAIYWAAQDKGWAAQLGVEYKAGGLTQHHLAKALEHPTSDAYRVSAMVLTEQGLNDDALTEINRAIELETNNPESYDTKAWILTLLGRAEEAETNARLAMRLNPEFSATYQRTLGRALFYQQRYSESAEVLELSVAQAPDYEFTYRLLAANYGHLGRIEEAEAAVNKYNELTAKTFGEKLTIGRVEFVYGDLFVLDKAYLALLLEGLRKAGVPEAASAKVTNVSYTDLVTRTADGFDVAGAVKIDAAGAKALFDRGAVVVDSRGQGPYSRGHIPGAINIHLSVLTEESLSGIMKLDQEVVFYCGGEGCGLSPKSCAKALTWGYSKVYYFATGYPAWKEAGYQVESQ